MWTLPICFANYIDYLEKNINVFIFKVPLYVLFQNLKWIEYLLCLLNHEESQIISFINSSVIFNDAVGIFIFEKNIGFDLKVEIQRCNKQV